MKTLALLSIMIALPLAAQVVAKSDGHDYCPTPDGSVSQAACPSKQTPLTPEEHEAYVLMVIQDLAMQNVLLDNLRTHKAGNDDLDNRDHAHAERVNALQGLLKKHNACSGGDWNIAKKEWACPAK